LVVVGEPGAGKSTVLAHWVKAQTKTKKDEDLFVYQMVDRSCGEHNYVKVLYRILNALRVTLDVQQQIEVTNDRIKSLFRAWLDTSELSHQQSNAPSRRVFIIIDGVDQFKHSNPSTRDWLPSEAPSFVKFIYSCQGNSKVAKFLKTKCEVVTVQPLDLEQRHSLLAKYAVGNPDFERIEALETWLKQDCCGNALYLHLLLSLATASTVWPVFPLDSFASKRKADLTTIEQLFIAAVSFFSSCTSLATRPASSLKSPATHLIQPSSKARDANSLVRVLQVLSISATGLLEEELMEASGVSGYDLDVIYNLFDPCFVRACGLISISNAVFRTAVKKTWPYDSKSLHLQLAELLEKKHYSSRRVEELTWHLSEAKTWLRLKDCLTEMLVFCTMYSPAYKLDLVSYWSQLVTYFDPVQEYNKSLEQFIAQYSPSLRDLFVLMLHFSCFMKDLSKIETELTPGYRHPPLKGVYELKEIHLLEEMSKFPYMLQGTDVELHSLSRALVADHLLRTEDRRKGAYFYKRWLWVEFPWTVLDQQSEFSLLMDKYDDCSDYLNFQRRVIKANTAFQIVHTAYSQADKRSALRNRSMSIRSMNKSGLVTSLSSSALEKSLMKTMNTPLSKSGVKLCASYERLSMTVIKEKRTAYKEHTVQFKNLSPLNIVDKVHLHLSSFTLEHLSMLKTQNYDLQRELNRKVHSTQLKTQQLVSLKSQLAKTQEKARAAGEMQLRMERIKQVMQNTQQTFQAVQFERIRLEHIVTCCMKNPSRNDEWQRGLEAAIESLAEFCQTREENCVKQRKEAAVTEDIAKELKQCFYEKQILQNSTIDRVTEQFQAKAYIISALVRGDNKRTGLLSKAARPLNAKHYRRRIREREQVMMKLQMYKGVLESRLAELEEQFSKFQTCFTSGSPQDLVGLLWLLERQEELKLTRERLTEKVEELRKDKDNLEVTLQKISMETAVEYERSDMAAVQGQLSVAEVRSQALHGDLQQVEGVSVSVQSFIESIAKAVKLNLEDMSQSEALDRISERLADFRSKIELVLGTSDYQEFMQMFPEVANSREAVSTADNIKYRGLSDSLDIPSLPAAPSFDQIAHRTTFKKSIKKKKALMASRKGVQ
jgi:hypothetical protein